VAPWIVSEDAEGVTIALRVIPRARRSEVTGLHAGALKVRLAAPPVEGAANEALVAFLAAALGVRSRDVHLVSGEHSRSKLVRVDGLDAATVKARLLPS
jgi:uncharacterized protein (TIGR00251 family)